MATMYDIAVAPMKIGVAIPISNSSFKWWDDPGTWVAPSAWTNNGSNLTVGRLWTGAVAPLPDDDNAAISISETSVPDDTTYYMASKPMQFWPGTALNLSGTHAFYYNIHAQYLLGTGGANKSIKVNLRFSSSESMSPSQEVTLKNWTTGSDLTWTQYTGTGTLSVTTDYDWVQMRVYFRDISGLSLVYLDSIGVMFSPLATGAAINAGYVELTGVYPQNGPLFTPSNFMQEVRTPSGVTRKHDPSGGAVKHRLQFQISQESQDIYAALWRLWNINTGGPGIPGLPLAIEPNLPGIPPVMYVNFVGNQFPLRKDTPLGQTYSGALVFETIY